MALFWWIFDAVFWPSKKPRNVKCFCLYFSAQTKSRLKWSILVHALMTLVMLAKLMPEILDRIDIFVLEVEELFLPKVRFGATSIELQHLTFKSKDTEGSSLTILSYLLFWLLQAVSSDRVA